VVYPGEAQAFLDPMPVDRLWGVGKKTVQELHQVGLYSIAQLREQTLEFLTAHFGENFAGHVHALAQGLDDRELAPGSEEKSISHECTFERDSADAEFLASVLLDLSERVARRARKDGRTGRTVTFVWRNPDFTRQSHARSLPAGTDSSQAIYEAALGLFREVAGPGGDASTGRPRKAPRMFRLIGVRLSNFSQPGQQTSLFEQPKQASGLDRAMDAVRDRFGEKAIRRARLAGPEE